MPEINNLAASDLTPNSARLLWDLDDADDIINILIGISSNKKILNYA